MTKMMRVVAAGVAVCSASALYAVDWGADNVAVLDEADATETLSGSQALKGVKVTAANVTLAAEDGACALEIDGIPLQIAETDAGRALVATAVVGSPPPEKTEAFLELLLEANTETLGPQDRALGKLHDTGEVVLQWRIPTRDLELEGFCTELETFVNQVEQWRLALENFRPAAEEAAAREDEVPALGLPGSGFISV